MGFDEYQKIIQQGDTGDTSKWVKKEDFRDPAFMEKALGLAGETGETVDKIKKVVRDKKGEPSAEDKIEIMKELGDVLWYTATIARYLGIPLSMVAEKNVIKMSSRKARGVLKGSGDNR